MMPRLPTKSSFLTATRSVTKCVRRRTRTSEWLPSSLSHLLWEARALVTRPSCATWSGRTTKSASSVRAELLFALVCHSPDAGRRFAVAG